MKFPVVLFCLVLPATIHGQQSSKRPEPIYPDEEHKQLSRLVGCWEVLIKALFEPSKIQEEWASLETKWILDGRYLQQEVKGTMAGQPYEGMGLMGYDNVMKERFATWADSMSTGILVMRGKCPADAKKCSTKGQTSDAVAGKMVTYTETTTFTDDNHFSFEMHGPGPGGKQFKMMEIVYTRE